MLASRERTLSHTFCGRTAGLPLLPVMKSVNYWPPAAALWISTLHSLCDLQRKHKYMIALTQTSKTCLEFNLARNQTPFHLIRCDCTIKRHQMGPGRPKAVFQRQTKTTVCSLTNQKRPQQTSIMTLAGSGSSRKRSLLTEKWNVWLPVRKKILHREASL